jgi:hypothetical protein
VKVSAWPFEWETREQARARLHRALEMLRAEGFVVVDFGEGGRWWHAWARVERREEPPSTPYR